MFEVLFQYGPFTLRTFNVFLAIAFLMTMIFLLRYIDRKKIPTVFLANHFIFLILIGFLGGRFLYIAENGAFFLQKPLQALYFWDLKLSAFGFLYSSLIALYFFARSAKENFWVWFDAFVLSGMVGLIFIHIGHFFNGTHYGVPTELPWGIPFDSINIPFINPIHPAQLYSALITFLIFGYAMKFNKRTHLSGMVGNLVIMLYCLSAFSIDFLHGTPSAYVKISYLAIAAAAFILFIHCSHKTYSPNK